MCLFRRYIANFQNPDVIEFDLYFHLTRKFAKETLSDHDGQLVKFKVSTWSPYLASNLSGRINHKI